MAGKRFSNTYLTTNNRMLCMTARNQHDTTVTIHVTNQNSNPIALTIWYSNQNNPLMCNSSEIIHYDQLYPGYTSIRIPGVVIEENHSIHALSSHDAVSIVIYGFEEVNTTSDI